MVPPPPGSSNADDPEKTSVIQGDQVTLNNELAKAKEQEACLIIIRGSPQGHRFFLTMDEMIIGRDPVADITVSDQSISRKHARMNKIEDRIQLTDLGSSNGTFVNDKKVESGQSVFLAKEDMVKLGNSIFKFLPKGELEILFYGALGAAAHTDALTRIYNRAYLTEALEAEFKRAKALHTDFSVVYFDLDHFKKINDNHGHDAGDYVLKEFASIIRGGFCRPKDVFARIGGEEFVILLAGTNAAKAGEIAEKIRFAVETHPFMYQGKRLSVTASLGVAELRTDIESPNTLLKAADKALYAAKTSGRNKVIIST